MQFHIQLDVFDRYLSYRKHIGVAYPVNKEKYTLSKELCI